MDKNIAAFLDDTAYTVIVQFGGTGHEYTYVTNLVGLQVGDAIVVPVTNAVRKERLKFDSINDGLEGVDRYDAKVATVVRVDESVNIEPDSTYECKWVISKVDFGPWLKTMERNNKIVDAVEDAYKRNLRRSFAERILGEMQDGPKQQLLALLGKEQPKPWAYEEWLADRGYPDSSKSLQAYQDYVKGFHNV